MGLCCNREPKKEPKYPSNIENKAEIEIDRFFEKYFPIQNKTKKGKKIKKGKKMSEKKFNIFLEYMEVKKNQEYFLGKLTDYRTVGYNISLDAFNYLEKIFSFIVDSLTRNNISNDISNENLGIFRNLIILSQTFYKITENEKIYLHEKLKDKEIFHVIEFWKKYSEYIIKQEIEKLIKNEETNQEGEKLDKLREKGAFSQLLDIIKNMKDFEFEKNQIKETIAEYIKQYNISEEYQLALNSIINQPIISKKNK